MEGQIASFSTRFISHFSSISFLKSCGIWGIKFFCFFWRLIFLPYLLLFCSFHADFSSFFLCCSVFAAFFSNSPHFSSISLLIFPFSFSLPMTFAVFRPRIRQPSHDFFEFSSFFFHIFAHIMRVPYIKPWILACFSKFSSLFFHIFAHPSSF